jgi:hypothetical protein
MNQPRSAQTTSKKLLLIMFCVGLILILFPVLWNPPPRMCYEQIGCVVKIYSKQKPGALRDFSLLINQLKQTNNQVRIIIFSEKVRVRGHAIINELGRIDFALSTHSMYGFNENAAQCELEDVSLVAIVPDYLNPDQGKNASFWLDGNHLGKGRDGLSELQQQLGRLDKGIIARAVGPHDMDSSWGPPGTEYPFKEEIGEAIFQASKRGVKIVHLP